MANAHAKAPGRHPEAWKSNGPGSYLDPLRVSLYVAEQGSGLADFELEDVLQGGALAKFDAQRVWPLRP
jgi:hypothetical protein